MAQPCHGATPLPSCRGRSSIIDIQPQGGHKLISMRRWIICAMLALAMAVPTISHAQQGPYNDKQNPNEYTDTEDSQLLKLVSYVLAPIGYALEWTVTRPMHNLATK